MKKDTEKQPIDDLFARKLNKLSLAPSPDSFERLQRRMNRDKPAGQVILWQNQTFYRYMTAAACLGLVCLFGWLYWHSGAQIASENTPAVAANPLKSVEERSDPVRSALSNEQKDDRRLALAEETVVNRKKSLPKSTRKPKLQLPSSSVMRSEPVLTQVEPANPKGNSEDKRAQPTQQADHLATEQGAGSPVTVKPNMVAERVLIVTIEEPAALVIARQKARDFVEEKAALTISDKAEKDVRRGVWQQVKRFKEGELFARHNEGSADEHGLLDRAYNGLKHSFDKNKSTRQ